MPKARFYVNLAIVLFANLHLYLSLQARAFTNLWQEESLRTMMILFGFCDVVMLLSIIMDFYIQTIFQLIYLAIFLKFRSLLVAINKNSHISQLFDVIVKQAPTHLMSVAFICLLIFTFILFLNGIIPMETNHDPTDIDEITTDVITWLYDNTTIQDIKHFVESTFPNASFHIPMYIFLFSAQFILKYALDKYFLSVVIECYKRYREFDSCVFSREMINELVFRWRQYDIEGEGLLPVHDYCKFIAGLKPPLCLTYEELIKRLGVTNSFFQHVQSTKLALRDDQGALELTTRQFFLYFEVYNVPVYTHLGRDSVHFRDVVTMLSRVAIENKYDLKESLKIESRRIENSLNDLWNERYPDLPNLKHKYEKLCTGYDSSRVFEGPNILSHKAAELLQQIYIRNRLLRNLRIARITNLRGILHREQEFISNERLNRFANLSKNHYIKQVMDTQIEELKIISANKVEKAKNEALAMARIEPASAALVESVTRIGSRKKIEMRERIARFEAFRHSMSVQQPIDLFDAVLKRSPKKVETKNTSPTSKENLDNSTNSQRRKGKPQVVDERLADGCEMITKISNFDDLGLIPKNQARTELDSSYESSYGGDDLQEEEKLSTFGLN
jgi:hypothetical protein